MTIAVPALPGPVPQSTDPLNFDARADATLGALPGVIAGMNAQNLENNAINAGVNAQSATATAAAASAQSNATAAALALGAVVWTSGTTYAVGVTHYSPLNQRTYRRTAAGAGTTDPSLDPTNWQPVALDAATSLPTLRPSLLLDFANSRTVDPRITFARASTGMFCDEFGVLRTAAAGVPRIDHSPLTGECLGLLLEEARTNLLPYSNDLSTAWTRGTAATWQPSGGLAPDGTMTALGVDGLSGVDILSTGTTLYRANAPVSAGTVYTWSIYVRSKSGVLNSVALRAADSAGGSTVTTGQTVGEQWTRLQVTATAQPGATTMTVLLGTTTGAANVWVWQGQLEAGSRASSPIITGAAAVTRAADAASITGAHFSRFYRQAEGTFAVEFLRNHAATGFVHALSARRAASQDDRHLLFLSANLNLRGLTTAGGATQADIFTGAAPLLTAPNKLAYAYAANNFCAAANGVLGTTDTQGGVPTNIDELRLGSLSTDVLNGHIRSAAYYPARLPNAALQALTA
jgi:hypothetical protein